MNIKYIVWNSEKVIKVLEGGGNLDAALYTANLADARVTEYGGARCDFIVKDGSLFTVETREIDTYVVREAPEKLLKCNFIEKATGVMTSVIGHRRLALSTGWRVLHNGSVSRFPYDQYYEAGTIEFVSGEDSNE